MRKVLIIIFAFIVVAVPLLFLSILDNPNYGTGGGNIRFDNASRLPYFHSRTLMLEDDGIEVIRLRCLYSRWANGSTIIRIKTHEAFVKLMEDVFIQFECEVRVEEALKTYSSDFFDNYDLIGVNFIAGASTIGLRLDNLTLDGRIQVTETLIGTVLESVVLLGYSLTIAFPINSNLPNADFRLVHRQRWIGR